ncbi:MAG TPA: response regulator transcription factor [Tepidiformaceae bacterium]|nr:response regulator transcription factor [Tepidiformaceae bacterium]
MTRPEPGETIHLLLADDHDLVRAGLKSTLRSYPEFSVVAEARDGREAVREALRTKPELVVMDVRMPHLSGIEACREIRAALPDTNVLILTSYADEKAVLAAIVAGASGFLLKEARAAKLIDAMRTVGRGGQTLDPVASAAVIDQIRKGNVVSDEDRLAQHLTERELAVLDLIADGMTNREIGEHLFLSEKTVKHHVSDVLSKLGLSRRVEAAAFAIRRAAQKPPTE